MLGNFQVFLHLLKLHLCPPDLRSLGVTAGALGAAAATQPDDGLQLALDLVEGHANQIDTAKVPLCAGFNCLMRSIICYTRLCNFFQCTLKLRRYLYFWRQYLKRKQVARGHHKYSRVCCTRSIFKFRSREFTTRRQSL